MKRGGVGEVYLTIGLFDLGNVISRTGFKSEISMAIKRLRIIRGVYTKRQLTIKWSANYKPIDMSCLQS